MARKYTSAGSDMVSPMQARVSCGAARLGVRGRPCRADPVGVSASGISALAPGDGSACTVCRGCLLCVAAALSLQDYFFRPRSSCNCSSAMEDDRACMLCMIMCRSTAVRHGMSKSASAPNICSLKAS